MGEIKRPPLVTTEGGVLADTSTGEVIPPVELRAPGPDPYTGAVLPVVSTGPLPAHPSDLPRAFERWKDDRDYVKKFLLTYLEEAEYNEKGRPINGRMHDYYRLPGKSDEYRPTAVGAEKVALFFGLFKGPVELHVLSETKEYVSVRARIILVDALGRVRGSAEKVISSAEATFQEYEGGLLKKYKGDARAALNDIASRAAKRAYVEAVSITCALGELFNQIAREKAGQKKQVGAGHQVAERPAPQSADPRPDARGLPTVMPVGKHAGTPLVKLESEFLKRARVACNGRSEYAKLAEAIDNVLESRRQVTA